MSFKTENRRKGVLKYPQTRFSILHFFYPLKLSFWQYSKELELENSRLDHIPTFLVSTKNCTQKKKVQTDGSAALF